jgi:hypothetical protein
MRTNWRLFLRLRIRLQESLTCISAIKKYNFTPISSKFLSRIFGKEFCFEISKYFVDLGEDAHVDLEPDESKHSQPEHREDDHVPKILHRLYHSTHNRLQPCNTHNR